MKLTVKNITRLALIAAAYAALTVALMPKMCIRDRRIRAAAPCYG